MLESLPILMNGKAIGTLVFDHDDDRYSFTYDAWWIQEGFAENAALDVKLVSDRCIG